MAVIFAIQKLYTDVETRFSDESTAVTMAFGWRAPDQHKVNDNRITWIPGRPGDGDAGQILPASEPGRNARSLATFGELFHVRIAGFDPATPEDELSQYHATRLLFDAWWRAAYLAARKTITVRSIVWNLDKKLRRHGAELICTFELEGMIPDTEQAIAPVDTTAAIDTSLEDVTETTVAVPP